MKKVMFMFAVLAMVFVSCTKEGKQGLAGKDGNANVISSTNVVLNNWTSDLNDGTNFSYSTSITWSAITQDIYNKGIVIAYFKSDPSWVALPYTSSEYMTTGGYYYYGTTTLSYGINVGSVRLEYSGYDEVSTPPTVAQMSGITVRLVAIPASVVAANPKTNWKNYNEVEALIHRTSDFE